MAKIFEMISTPAVLLEDALIDANIGAMQSLADRNKVNLRVHIKTHKIPELAKRQLRAGAVGIAVAKLAEAEIMAATGIKDIQIANIIVGVEKFRRIKRLTDSCRISLAVDSVEHLRMISEILGPKARVINLLCEINTGLNRAGIDSFDRLEKLFIFARRMKNINLVGLMTHAGHGYGAANKDELEYIGTMEGATMVEYAARLRRNGYDIKTVSVGSTPTARYCAAVKAVTELRVGNYIFNDMTQVSLGVASPARCALTVLATVISVPSRERVIIDAGSKAFGLDRGAHGKSNIEGYGFILGKKDRLTRLSEEHGIIDNRRGRYHIGEKIRIIPNHACTVMNLFDFVYLVNDGKVMKKLAVAARGKSD